MGGKGSGGRRIGSGRKKKPTHLRGIDGGAGRRGPAPASDAELPPVPTTDAALLEPPAGSTVAEAAIWRSWAPQVIVNGTLTASTSAAFAHVVQLQVEVLELDDALGVPRASTGEPRPLLVMDQREKIALQRLRLSVRKELNARLKDFMLAPFGKELAPPGDPGDRAVDPIDRFMRK